jgi:hypothetical protein
VTFGDDDLRAVEQAAQESGPGPVVTDEELGTSPEWAWSPAACAAFVQAATARKASIIPSSGEKAKARFNIRAGLRAAMETDIERIFGTVLVHVVERLTTHPFTRDRVLVIKAQPDGKAYLKVDRDLIQFILFNTVPEAVDERFRAEAPTEEVPDAG